MPNERLIAVLLTVVSIAIRLYYSTAFYLNPDESIHFNAGSAGQWVIHLHPPLVLWWIWLATLLSEQEWWVRLFSTLAGGLTPLVIGLWLRRFLSPATAWGVAALVALSPNLVMLSIQIRGYSAAMFFTAAVLYTLDRAIEERSKRMLFWHFVSLYLGILAEFCTAWVVLAAGLYGVAVFIRRPETRSLLPQWLAGQTVAAAIYGLLYVFLVRAIAPQFGAIDQSTSYLRAAFPQAGESEVLFFAAGAVQQFAYVTSSSATGLLAALLAGLGLVVWIRKGDQRAVLVMAMYLAGVAALAMLHPFGRTRHTVVIGLVSLAAVGAGIDVLGRWRFLAGMIFAWGIMHSTPDALNIPKENWRKDRLEQALREMDATIPARAIVMGDSESIYMLKARLPAREDRRVEFERAGPLRYKGQAVVEGKAFDWSQLSSTEIRAAAGVPVWIVDMGFGTASVKGRREELGVVTVLDEPGVLYLGRLP